MKKITNSEKETKIFAQEFIKKNQKNILLLYGNLGSGKTIFVKGIAKFFKIKSTITSPTFVLIKEYKINNKNFRKLIHIDLYRINILDQDLIQQIKEYIQDKQNLVIIEWPEKISKKISKFKSQKIYFYHFSKNKREIKIQ